MQQLSPQPEPDQSNFTKSEHKIEAKLKLVEAVRSGTPWRQAAIAAGLSISRTTSYRYCKGYHLYSLVALRDGRQGHPAKLKPPVQAWLIDYCRQHPQTTSPQLQSALHTEFGLKVSVSHLNNVRQSLALTRQALSNPTLATLVQTQPDAELKNKKK